MSLGARQAYLLLVLYLMEAVEELGSKRAFELLEEAAREQGRLLAPRLLEGLAGGPLERGAEAYRRFMEGAGAQVKLVRKEEGEAVFAVQGCPFFQVFLDVGVDCGIFREGLCTHFALPSVERVLASVDPRLGVEAQSTKEAAEDICLERVFLREG